MVLSVSSTFSARTSSAKITPANSRQIYSQYTFQILSEGKNSAEPHELNPQQNKHQKLIVGLAFIPNRIDSPILGIKNVESTPNIQSRFHTVNRVLHKLSALASNVANESVIHNRVLYT